jgi:hypothetical protein
MGDAPQDREEIYSDRDERPQLGSNVINSPIKSIHLATQDSGLTAEHGGSNLQLDYEDTGMGDISELDEIPGTPVGDSSSTSIGYNNSQARLSLRENLDTRRCSPRSTDVNPGYKVDSGPSPLSLDSRVSSGHIGTTTQMMNGETAKSSSCCRMPDFNASQELLKYYIDSVAPWVCRFRENLD